MSGDKSEREKGTDSKLRSRDAQSQDGGGIIATGWDVQRGWEFPGEVRSVEVCSVGEVVGWRFDGARGVTEGELS